MKPEDLKPRFTFENRLCMIDDGVFYLPEYFQEYHLFAFPSWQNIFNNELPVAIEFCAGNGAWIQARAETTKSKNWVAVEKRFDRVRKIWAKRKNYQLDNLFTVCGEGYTFVTNFVSNNSVSEVYVNFPDPWPKKRHAKHRIMKESFLNEMVRILVHGGHLTFVTDDKEYLEATLALFAQDRRFIQRALVQNPIDYGTSYFDNLWREKGRTIYYAQYCTE